MRRALIAVLLAAALAVSTTKPAEARWGWGWGWGLGAFAVGALIGAALWRPAYSYYYPAYSYGGYYGGYGGYGGYYGGYSPYYGYRVARRSSAIVLARAKSPIVLARAKKNSEIALAGAKIRRVHGVASLASSTATSSRTHPPKRVQGRFATGGSTARNAI